jgi:DNA-binding transcriptional MerR regulator
MPVTYATLTARDRDWGLEDFVATVNQMLPEVVPSDAASRGKLEVNPRLVRHYTTEGVLPKPLKEGVEARYDADHLVRLLALRRLLAEGYPSAVAGRFLQRYDRENLARFLLGELRPDLDLAPGGPTAAAVPAPSPAALARLAELRARANLPPLDAAGRPPSGPTTALHDPALRDPALRDPAPRPPRAVEPDVIHAPADARPVVWVRHPLMDGVELHVRDDVAPPTTRAAWQGLRDALLTRIEAIFLERPRRR